MLDKLRDQAFQAFATTPDCTLSTVGPAGLRASNVALSVESDCLYMLIPTTSDHIFNLESEQTIVLTADKWQLTGTVSQVDIVQVPFTEQQVAWSVAYEVTPLIAHLAPDDENQQPRTIDF